MSNLSTHFLVLVIFDFSPVLLLGAGEEEGCKRDEVETSAHEETRLPLLSGSL